jgi:hypothetical protein
MIEDTVDDDQQTLILIILTAPLDPDSTGR